MSTTPRLIYKLSLAQHRLLKGADLAFREAAGISTTQLGVLFFLLWAFTEVLQQAILLVSMNLRWRREFLATTSVERQTVLRAHIEGVDAISDGLFLVILLAFIVANVLFAGAVLPGQRTRDRVASTCFAVGALLGIISLSETLGYAWGGAAMEVLYPLLQPGARLVIGIWLWRSAQSMTETSP